MKRIVTLTATLTLAAIAAAAAGLLGPSGDRAVAVDGASTVAAASTTPATTGPPTGPGPTASGTTSGAEDTVELQRLIHRPGQQIPGTDTGRWSSMVDFMTWVEQDVAVVWNWYYGQWKYGIKSDAQLVFPLPDQRIATPCGPTDDRTMFYCPPNDTIYFSQALATALWQGTYVGPDGQRSTRLGGDFAVVTMLAHEYGHNVQQELGILGKGYQVARTEQMADCLSGSFARQAYYQNVLDPNDVTEGLNVAYMVGDSQFSNRDHHGTSAERVASWKLGYGSASPSACWSILG